MVTQLTCPFQDHAPLLRGKLCLFHLPQPPSLTPNTGVVGGILGLVAVAETCTVQEICKTQVAQRFSEVAHTGERRDRVRNGEEEAGGTGCPPWQQPLV